MTTRARRGIVAIYTVLTGACSRAPGPAAPSGPVSFLAGRWHGTLTIQVDPGLPGALPATTGSTMWTLRSCRRRIFRRSRPRSDPNIRGCRSRRSRLLRSSLATSRPPRSAPRAMTLRPAAAAAHLAVLGRPRRRALTQISAAWTATSRSPDA